MKLPVVLDTDIGTDIDDVYALILAAVSPELDLRAVTTVNNDTTLRARIAKAILRLLGREDVPVAAGAGESLTSNVCRGRHGREGEGIDLSEIDPTVDVSSLDGPALIAKSAATQRVLDSEIPLTLIGLNVTRQTTVTRARVDRIAEYSHPLAKALVGMHRIWLEIIGKEESPMHDSFAVASAFRPDLVTLEPIVGSIWKESPCPGAILFNRPNPGKVTRHQAAMSVDTASFHALLDERIGRALGGRSYNP